MPEGRHLHRRLGETMRQMEHGISDAQLALHIGHEIGGQKEAKGCLREQAERVGMGIQERRIKVPPRMLGLKGAYGFIGLAALEAPLQEAGPRKAIAPECLANMLNDRGCVAHYD